MVLTPQKRLVPAPLVPLVWLVLVSPALVAPTRAAQPSVSEALKLKPIQSDIDYDLPDDAAAEKCSLNPINAGNVSGWEVRDGDGNVLRRFLDTNNDNKVDQWCYFKDGIEVYRDIDSDFNRKADQYRWLGTAGIRWALDTNEDGRIDQWKTISPEEVSEEVIAALGARDAVRFRRLLLTVDELKTLQLGDEQEKLLSKKIAETAAGSDTLARTQKLVERDTSWVNFGGTRPGVVPAGTDGSKRDLQVYENAAAVVETAGTHTQIIIGTLVRTGEVWRVIDLPQVDGRRTGQHHA